MLLLGINGLVCGNRKKLKIVDLIHMVLPNVWPWSVFNRITPYFYLHTLVSGKNNKPGSSFED